MKKKTETLVLLLLCAMVMGGCKSKTSENIKPDTTETVITSTEAKQEDEQQNKETESPEETEKDQGDNQDTKTTKAPENKEQTEEEQENKTSSKEEENKEPSKEKGYKVVLKKGEVSSNGNFKVTYPQIEGWTNQKSMEYWNGIFAAANYGSEDDGVDAYTLNTTVMTENSQLLSILMEGSIRYEGVNETTNFAYTYNINMKTGKSYRLEDSKANLSKIEDKLMNENYEIVTKNKDVSMVAVLDTLYLKNEKDDDVARVKEALKECDYDENNSNPSCYSYWKNGKLSLVFDVDEEIGGYTIFELK